MKRIRFLGLEEVLALHADQIACYGGAPGVRDLGLLESAVAAPEASYGGGYLHGTLHEMAAAYLFHLAQNLCGLRASSGAVLTCAAPGTSEKSVAAAPGRVKSPSSGRFALARPGVPAHGTRR